MTATRPADVLVVGESITNPPFTGPIYGQIRVWLRNVGISPATDVTYVVLSDACAGNVDWLQPRWLLALGERALAALCPIRSMTLKHAHGHFWKTRSGMAMATYSPASVKHNGEWGRWAQEDIETLAHARRDQIAEMPVARMCVRCGKEPVVVAVDGIGLGKKCRRFARPVLVQDALFESRVKDPT